MKAITDLIKDVLLKAAEDVQAGMWCQHTLFKIPGGKLVEYMRVEELLGVRRCAEGSIYLASRLLIKDPTEANILAGKASNAVHEYADKHQSFGDHQRLWQFNDYALPRDDPFEAGQRLASLFREVEASL